MRRCLNGCARQLIGHVPDPPRIQKDTEIASPAYTKCACQVDELGIPDTEQSRWVAVRMGPGRCVHCPLFSPRTGTSALRRSSAVLCKAEVLRWILDESLSKTAQEPHGLPSIAATIAITALSTRSEAGAIGVIVDPFNAGVRFIPGERNLSVAGLPAGAVWIGDSKRGGGSPLYIDLAEDGRRFRNPSLRPFRWFSHRVNWPKPSGTQVNPAHSANWNRPDPAEPHRTAFRGAGLEGRRFPG